jgi:predicted nucleotidyltransferase
MNLPQDFRDLLAAFASAGVESVLVGGYAVAYHARPRATKDIDLVLRGDAANLSRAANALREFGAQLNVADAVGRLGETEVAWMGQPPLRIDLLRSIDGVSPDELFRDALTIELDGVRLRVISKAHLIANKRAAGRPQDLVDADLLARATPEPER